MGVVGTPSDLSAEPTITLDGAFWSPFGPTVHHGVPETDVLIIRTIRPLSVPAQSMLRVVRERPPGGESTLNIR